MTTNLPTGNTVTVTDNPTADNGVAIEALRGARAALTDAPAAARFQWRAANTWVNGTHSRTRIERFAGLGDEHSHRRPYEVDTDHPQIFASEDNGPTPAELVLAGLAGCLSAGVATVATNRGVTLRSVTATVEGDMDIQGILGIDPAVRNGFSAIRVRYEIDADVPKADVEAIVVQSQKRSAVFDIITNPTNVRVEVA
jgi:uncharacterized OsmC-like protein